MLRKTRLEPTARLRAALLLVCCACLLSVVALGQQPGKSAPAQTGQRPQKSKQIFLSGKNESPRGSSVTIRSDTPLNDYSAYRSGDRFYVVIPKASANSMPRGASGRGFADMQVQQRGNDVVLSYKLQPGAKPRVNQRFDRLDVVFDTPEGSSAQNAQQNTPAPTQQPADRGNNTPQANPRQTTTTPAATTPTTTDPARTNTQQQPATQTPTAVAPGASALPGATQSPLEPTAPTVTDSPLPETSPTPADAASQQVAQTQPPATTAPITTTNPAASRPSSGSFAAAVLNNWPAIIGVLLLAGMVLFIMAQRSASRRNAAAQAGTKTTTDTVAATHTAAALKETPTLKTTTVEKTTTTAPVAPAIATEKKDKKDKKDKKKADTTSPSLAAPISAPVAEKTTEASQTQASDAVKEADEVTLVSARQEPSPLTASVEPPATAATTTTATVVSLPTSEVSAEPKKSLLDEQVTSKITPVIAVDAERVQVEIKRLLDGQAYDKGTLSSADMMTRQMIAAELLAALAGRNPERKQRARTAFVEQGFFNETAHDLHFAGAPAERASAARSLGLLGDRVATSHLIAALADQTMEVRRACVEALSEVRDPKAVAPLKSLLEREKELKVKVPRKLIQRAIEACERGDELLTPTATAIAVAPAATETAATEPVAAEVATPEVLAPVEPSSQLTPTVDEETPTLVEDETPTLVTSEPVVEEQATRSVELEPVAAFEPSPALEEETPTVLTPAPLDIERAEVAPVSVHVEEDVIDLNLEPEVATTAVAAEADREAEDAALPPLAAEPSMPFFAGETLAVPTEELNASAEELTVSPTAPTAPEFETHRAETLDTSAAVAPVEGFETTQARDSELRSEFDWIELDDLHAPPPSAPSAPTNAAATQDEPQEIDLTEEVSLGGFEPQPITAEASSAREAFNPPQASPTLAWDKPTLDANAETAAPVVETPAEPVETRETRGAAALEEDFSTVPKGIQQRLASDEPAERAAGVKELARLGGGDDAFHVICAAFDDPSQDVRSAAARTLFEMQDDRAESFTRALREAPPERRRHIGGAIASSGLATEAIGQLTGASRDKTYEAFSLLFLMAKAGEVQPLVRAIEAHPDNEVRLAVVKLLALSGQRDILPAFRRLAVRGSLPTEVRSAVMEAIYQISSSTSNTPQDTSPAV